MSRHTPRLSDALDKLILEIGSVPLARAWFREVDPAAVDERLDRASAELLEHGGFVHPATWLKSLKETGQ